MSLGNCVMCWEDVCMCGHDYQYWRIENIVKLRNILDQEINKRSANIAPINMDLSRKKKIKKPPG